MKENIQKSGLIDDDDEEGGDEPDLIANHELNDIVDKQYNEISDLQIKVADNEEVEKKCVMNQRHLLDYKYTYITCNCIYCPELGDNICFECIKNCHSDHITDKLPVARQGPVDRRTPSRRDAGLLFREEIPPADRQTHPGGGRGHYPSGRLRSPACLRHPVRPGHQLRRQCEALLKGRRYREDQLRRCPEPRRFLREIRGTAHPGFHRERRRHDDRRHPALHDGAAALVRTADGQPVCPLEIPGRTVCAGTHR